MTRALERLLSRGVAHLQRGATIDQFMHTPEAARLRPGQREELRSLLEVAGDLIPLQTTAFPAPPAQMLNRARFLGQAAQWREERRTHPLRGWTHAPLRALRGLFIFTLAAVLVTAVGVAPAAAASLPDSRLYVLKTIVEDVRIALALDPSARADLCLNLADLRTQEMLRLSAEAHPANEAVVARMEQHLQTALLAAKATRGAAQYFWLQRIVSSADGEQSRLRQASTGASEASQAMLSHAADIAEGVAGQARQLLQELPVPMPSATPQDTQTPTPTLSTTPSGTLTGTLTPEASATATASLSAPLGATEEIPAARTSTPITRTPATPSATPTATTEPSPTQREGAATALPGASPTCTPTRTAGHTRTRTPTPSETSAGEPTATGTHTPTRTGTPTVTLTPRPTQTETPGPTDTPIPVYELSLLDNPDPVPAGNRIHYNVLLRNLGELALTRVRVTVAYSGGCAYYAPNNPGSISWAAGTVAPHSFWAVEFTLETYSVAEGCTVSVNAGMTCDQGTAQASTTTRVGPTPPMATATVTITPTATNAPIQTPTP